VCYAGEVWLNEYDPLHIMLRAVYRREIQQSVDRYTELYVCLWQRVYVVICLKFSF